MGRTRQNLDGLPLETLHQIAGHLHATNRASLYAFGLVNERCHRANLPEVFRELHLTVRNRHAMQREVDTLTEILSRTDSARHVRRLKIKGFPRSGIDGSDTSKHEPEACEDDSQEMSWFNTTGHGEIFPDEEPVLCAEHVCRDKPVIIRFSEEDMV